ncbi:MAG: hypothetical protein HGA79_02270, partial [Anaerolineales bacterium]|nr:hypothetical protein [Anaerolineales bacterium]
MNRAGFSDYLSKQFRRELILDSRRMRKLLTFRPPERELASIEQDLSMARQKADDTPLAKELSDTQAKIETLTQRESLRDEFRQRKNSFNEEAASLRGQNERLGPETEPLKAAVDLLESSTEP